MEKEVTKLEGTEDKGRVRILKAILYKSHQIVIRMIGEDYFEYLLEYNGQIYSSYIIITPAENKEKLTEEQIAECRDLIYAGAEATLDQLLGVELDKQQQEYIEVFEENRKKIEKGLEKEKDGKKETK